MWDLYAAGGYLFGDTVEYPDFGVSVEIEDTWIGGIGISYHLSHHWSVGSEIQLGQTDFNSGS